MHCLLSKSCRYSDVVLAIELGQLVMHRVSVSRLLYSVSSAYMYVCSSFCTPISTSVYQTLPGHACLSCICLSYICLSCRYDINVTCYLQRLQVIFLWQYRPVLLHIVNGYAVHVCIYPGRWSSREVTLSIMVDRKSYCISGPSRVSRGSRGSRRWFDEIT